MSEEKVNFQIQYFDKDKKDEFKEFCRSNKMSMKEMVYFILEEKKQVQVMLDERVADVKE